YIIISLIYSLSVAGLLYICLYEDIKRKVYVPVKMVASTLFIVLALVSRWTFIMLIPLGLCWLGDLFMGLFNILHKRRFMGAGAAAFMLAHIGFLVILIILEPKIGVLDIVFTAVGVVLAAAVIKLCDLHTGNMTGLCICYAAFISAFSQRAVRLGIAWGGDPAWILGGLLFFVSDLLILFLYFKRYKVRALKKVVQIANLATYYMAIGFIIAAA
ncbi:MAG: hypothetical protein J6N76_03790, partial [Lachnospiraceae bacterium]|nr:hypothetical protein [Lachnospiraceae bacterium]